MQVHAVGDAVQVHAVGDAVQVHAVVADPKAVLVVLGRINLASDAWILLLWF